MSRRLLALATFALLAATACVSQPTRRTPPPYSSGGEEEHPSRPAGPETAPERDDPSAALDRAQQGDALYAAGEYEAAAGAYAEALARRPDHPSAAWILFRMAIVQLLPESEVHDPVAGTETLERLVAEHPDSPAASSARLILGLVDELDTLEVQTRRQQTTIEELRQQLETLKQIDMEHSGGPPPR